MELIISHVNADFDSLASMTAASRLYPGAVLCFPGSQEKNLREFSARHPDLLPPFVRVKDIDVSAVSRLVIVDCQHAGRIGKFADLLQNPDIEIHLYDHHPQTAESISFSLGEVRPSGSTTTILCNLLRQRMLTPTPAEATLMLLAIHEDTGRLCFSNVTPEDYMAAAWLLECGGRVDLVSEAVAPEMTTFQVELLHDLLKSLKTSEIDGVKLSVAHASRSWYVGDIADLVHMIRDMENLDVLLVAVAMAERVHLVARSRVAELDAGELLRNFGGGGHAAAASATIRGQSLSEVLTKLDRCLLMAVRPVRTVGQIMSTQVKTAEASETVASARDLLLRYNYSAMPVFDNNELAGIITRKVAEKSVYHGLGDRPVTEFMHTEILRASPDTPVSELMDYMIGGDRRFVPVFDEGKMVGVITRTDLLRHLHGTAGNSNETLYDLDRLLPEPKERELAELLRRRLSAETVSLLEQLGSTGEELGVTVFAVGGFVRDLLLGIPNLDLDVTLEGDGIFFAETFGARHCCHVSPHHAFGTAVIVLPDGRKLDIASTRLEYYESPGVLPTVERASLRQDLYRRDFTINTFALSLNSNRFGLLLDFFGGQKDLQDRLIRVLHNLSFVEDPTRAFRAVRFEQRLGFRIEPHTEGLLRSAVRAGLVAKVGGKRIQGELIHILRENAPAPAIRRMGQLGLLSSVHPALHYSPDNRLLFEEVEKVLAWYQLLYLQKAAEGWIVWFLALADKLDATQYLELCQHLLIPAKLMDRVLGQRHRALRQFKTMRQTIASGHPVKNSQIYKWLHGTPIELLLYGLARSGSIETLRRLVSRYLTHLSDTKIHLSGNDLMKLGIRPGPCIRMIKEKLLSARLDGEVSSRDEELEMAANLTRQHQQS